jgi:hypothetical protein
MRRLTLILSDLYLPADMVRESFPTALELPALAWLLRFARAPQRIGDWRSWLARELGANSIAGWPVAHVCALAAGAPLAGAWLATPVALEARLDHVRLRDRGLLRLPLQQQQALQREFAQVFGDSISLQASDHPSMALRGGPAVDIATQDPARLLDSDIGHALPTGTPAAGALRRLGAEIEMWLHSSPLNAARVQAGQRRIAAMWLWGGGTLPPTLRDPGFAEGRFHLQGTDGFVHAMQKLSRNELPDPMPARFDELRSDIPTFVELAPMSGAATETLPELERNWFEPARAALSAGKLDALRLVANDRVFTFAGRAHFKFWRRRRSWLESLA